MHPETWNKAVEKGRLLHTAMNAPLNSEHTLSSPWTSYTDLTSNGWTERDYDSTENIYDGSSPYSSYIRRLMNDLNISTTPSENPGRTLVHSKDSGILSETPFRHTDASNVHFFNISSGTIFVRDITSPREKMKDDGNDVGLIPSDPEVLQHWSDIAFLQWQNLVPDKAALQGLRRVVHCKVDNSVTIAVMRKVLWKGEGSPSGLGKRVVAKVTVDDGDDFLALLGTPNGSGVGYLLAQHKEQLGCKSVKSISVYLNESWVWILVLDTEA